MGDTKTYNMELIVDGNRGIYGPQVFCQKIFPAKIGDFFGCAFEAVSICLLGPDEEDYWDTWDYLTRNFLNEKEQVIYENDGDIWLATPQELDEMYANEVS
jgi:hypothetical protein